MWYTDLNIMVFYLLFNKPIERKNIKMIISAAAALSSRFAPIPKDLHIGFCVFATVLFLIIFLRQRTVSSIIWALICDSTAILQFFDDSNTAFAVGLCEVLLFCILIWFSRKEWREREQRDAAEEALEIAEEVEVDPDGEGADRKPDDLEDIARLVRFERRRLADNDDDIIKNAFEEN